MNSGRLLCYIWNQVPFLDALLSFSFCSHSNPGAACPACDCVVWHCTLSVVCLWVMKTWKEGTYRPKLCKQFKVQTSDSYVTFVSCFFSIFVDPNSNLSIICSGYQMYSFKRVLLSFHKHTISCMPSINVLVIKSKFGMCIMIVQNWTIYN